MTRPLALVLATDAHRNARTDPDGAPVPLEDQDRRRWDAEKTTGGRALVTDALAAPPPSPHAVQAATAALHDEAPDAATTDWAQVVALHDVLLRLTPSPAVRLNRAVTVAVRDGPAAGLALIDRVAEAAGACRTALQRVCDQPERTYLTGRPAGLVA